MRHLRHAAPAHDMSIHPVDTVLFKSRKTDADGSMPVIDHDSEQDPVPGDAAAEVVATEPKRGMSVVGARSSSATRKCSTRVSDAPRERLGAGVGVSAVPKKAHGMRRRRCSLSGFRADRCSARHVVMTAVFHCRNHHMV